MKRLIEVFDKPARTILGLREAIDSGDVAAYPYQENPSSTLCHTIVLRV